MNLQFLALTAFTILAGAEAWVARRSGRRYSLNIAVSNMSCGALHLCTYVFYAGAFTALYTWVYTRLRLIDGLGRQYWAVIAAFLLVDLSYYAYHRASHRVAILWAAHIVHHESDEYNLTVSLRQGSAALFSSIPFELIPALIGVPLPVFLAMHAVYNLYQFFVHTAPRTRPRDAAPPSVAPRSQRRVHRLQLQRLFHHVGQVVRNLSASFCRAAVRSD